MFPYADLPSNVRMQHSAIVATQSRVQKVEQATINENHWFMRGKIFFDRVIFTQALGSPKQKLSLSKILFVKHTVLPN